MSAPSTTPQIDAKPQSFPPGFIAVTPRASHLVVVKLSSTWLDCRIADRHLQHETRFGHFAILPDGADCSAAVDGGIAQTMTLVVNGEAFAAFADDGRGRRALRDVLRGHDLRLAAIALSLDRADPSDLVSRDKFAHDAMAHITAHYATVVPVAPQGPLAPKALQTVRAFIFDNVCDDLSIARLADVARLSPFHFSRAFTRATGIPPHRYIMQARTDQAAAAIRTGRQSLAEIAYAHGFTDQSHMCRWIRRRYGKRPTALRDAPAIG